jgi:hypothetical protein
MNLASPPHLAVRTYSGGSGLTIVIMIGSEFMHVDALQDHDAWLRS